MSFYAYIHCKPDGTPFYVGKGNESRARSVKRANKWHSNIVEKYGKDSILIGRMECSSDETAIELEKGLIKRLKAMGAEIVNQTDGGDGAVGYRHTDEFKKKTSERLIGNTLGRLCKHTDEWKKSLSQKMLGNKYGLGKKHTPESIEKMRIAQRARTKESRVGVKYSVETCIARSRRRGGAPIEMEKDGVVLRFETIHEAARATGANPGNISTSLRNQKAGKKAWKVCGWTPRLAKE